MIVMRVFSGDAITVSQVKAFMPMTIRLLIVAFTLGISGCAQVSYYTQAAQGQLRLANSAKPVDTWLSDPAVSAETKHRLQRAVAIRRFAVDELSLPDNGSYSKYADIKRPYVMWNVVATPELSLKPIQWCFPIAGCVEYKGYYNKEAAHQFARELRAMGYEVRVSGVPAYSTLGWFNDPLLSSFITYPEVEVARMLFHELAHQVAYAPGDTQFNEGFATAVETIGVQRWLNFTGDEETRRNYEEYRKRKRDFLLLLANHRNQLRVVYESNISDAEKRVKKTAVMSSLQQTYNQIKQERWNGYAGYDNWFNEPLTNAHLALVALYEDLAPAFQSLYEHSGSLPQFYAEVKVLSKYDKAKRHQALAALPLPKRDDPLALPIESKTDHSNVSQVEPGD